MSALCGGVEQDGKKEMTPGIHKMTMAEYLADPCPVPSLSAGVADTLLRQSPLHAKTAHPKLNPDYRQAEDGRFDIGTAAHSLILEGDDKVAVCEFDDWRTKAAKEQRDLARANGMTPLLAKHYAAVKEMVGVARYFIQACEIGKYLKDAEPEMTCVARRGGIWMRSRPDLLSLDRKINVHYKTCENAAPETFCRQIPRMGYDLAAVFYDTVLDELGFKSESFFIAQEITPPYACSLIGLDPAARDVAMGKLEYACEAWKRCLSSGRWGTYPLSATYASPSSYELDAAEDRRLTFDERLELATQG